MACGCGFESFIAAFEAGAIESLLQRFAGEDAEEWGMPVSCCDWPMPRATSL